MSISVRAAMGSPRTPHNELFLFAFEDPEVACTELEAVLPPALVDELDLSRLGLEPNRLIEEDLSARFCDVLYRVPLMDGSEAIVWILLEHQSTDDPMMGLRLLEYMVRVWSKLRRAAEQPPVRLPPIVPVVLQHDEAGWRAPRQFADLYAGGEALLATVRGLVPDFTYLLDDLSETTDEAIAARTAGSPFLRLVLWSLRSRGRVDPSAKARWIEGMQALAEAGKHDAAMAVVKYHLSVTETGEPVALQAAREADPGLERSCMTYVEKLRAEGRAEGEARGEARGEAKALLKLITLKFGEPGEETAARVEGASTEELDRWLAGILTAHSLEELFTE